MYSRISDIQAGIEQDGTTLGNYSGKLAELGINVLDTNGKLRDMGEVIEQIGGKWKGLTREQQINIAQIMAGQRQYSNLIALFDGFDQYTKAMQTAAGAAGTLQKQQDIYMQSTAAHLQQMKASFEDVYDSLFDNDSIQILIDGISQAADTFATFIDSIGGGGQLLESLGSIAVGVFSQQIAKSLNTTINNIELAKNQAKDFKQALQNNIQIQNIKGLDQVTQQLLQDQELVLQIQKGLSPEEFNGLISLTQQMGDFTTQVQVGEEKLKEYQNILNSLGQEGNLGKKLFGNDDLESIAVVDDIEDAMQIQKMAFDQLSESITFLNEKVDEAEKETKEYKKSIDELQNEIADYLNLLDELNNKNALGKYSDGFKKLMQDADKLKRQNFTTDEDYNKALQAFADKTSRLGDRVNKHRQQILQEALKSGEFGDLKAEIQKARKNGEELGEEFKRGIEKGIRTQQIQAFTSITSGLGQVSMGIQQIQNLGSIWANSELSQGQKILQTITNLSFSIPMLINGFKNLKGALDSLQTVGQARQVLKELNQEIATTATESLAEEANQAAKQGTAAANERLAATQRDVVNSRKENIEATNAETLSQKMRQGSKGSNLDDELEDGGQAWLNYIQHMDDAQEGFEDLGEDTLELFSKIRQGSDQLDDGGQAWLNYIQGMEQSGAVATTFGEKITAALGSAKASVTGLLASIGPLIGAVAGIGIALGGVAIGVKMWQQQKKNAMEAAQATQEAEQKTQEQIKSHEELYASLEELDTQYKNGQITRAELQSSVIELTSQYGDQDQAVQKLRNSYLGLSGAIEEAKKTDRDELIASNQREIDALQRQYQNNVNAKKKVNVRETQPNKTDQIILDKLLEKGIQPTKTFDPTTNLQSFDFHLDTLEDAKNLYEALNDIIKETKLSEEDLADASIYQGTLDVLSQYGEDIDTLNQKLKQTNELKFENQIDAAKEAGFIKPEEVDSLEEYLQLQQTLVDMAHGDVEVANKAMAKNFSQLLNKYGDSAEIVNKIKEAGYQLTDPSFIERWTDLQKTKFLSLDPSVYDSYSKLKEVLKQINEFKFDNLGGLSIAEIDKSLDAARTNYNTLQDAQDKLKDGGSISQKEYDQLTQAYPQLKQFLQQALDGTAHLKVSAEQFNQAVNNIKMEPFQTALAAIQKQLESFGNKDYSDFQPASDTLTQNAANLPTQAQNPLLSVSQQSLGQDQLDYITKFGDMNHQLVQQINEWKAAIKDGGVAANQAYAQMAQKVKQVSDNTKQAAERQKELQQKANQLKDAIKDAIDPVDEDVDQGVLNNLADSIQEAAGQSEDFAEALKDNRGAAEEIAESFLRFNDAIEDITKNAEKWKKTLNSLGRDAKGNIKNLTGLAEITQQLSDAYGDLLNIDGDALSDSFLSSAENLEKAEEAAQGSTEALQDLKEEAFQDILIQIEADGNDQLDSLVNQFDYIKDYMENTEIQAGQEIDDTKFIQSCQAIADQAFKTYGDVDTAMAKTRDAIGSIGADVSLTPITENSEDVMTIASATYSTNSQDISAESPHWISNPVAGKTFPQVSGSNRASGHVVSFSANVDTEQVPNPKSTTITGIKVDRVGAGASGQAKINNAKQHTTGGGGKGGKKSGGCFAAQTLITIPNNKYKFIEDIQIGDIVLSYNVEKRVNEYSKVVETMIHDLEESIYTIYIENDILVSTGIHPFYIVREQSYEWVEASDLNIGDLVLFADGTIHQISNIEVNYRSIRVYNFEVSGNHNYYVGINQILVHNKGKGGKGKSAKKDTSKATAIKKETKKTDPYFRVNRQLSNQEHILKDLEKSTERAFGKNKLDLLKKQAEALQEQNKLLKEKQELNKKEIDSLNKRYKASNKLSKKNKDDDVAAAIGLTKKEKKKTKNKSEKKQGSKLKKEKFKNEEGYGFKYDSDGEITNYTQLQNSYYKQMEKRRKQYNKAKKKYDAMTKKEQKDKYKQNVLEVLKYNYQLWKDRLDKMKDAAEKYVDELELNKEITEKLQENFAAEIQLRIQKFAVAVEVDLDLREAIRKWNDFERNVLNKQDLLKRNPLKDITLDMQRALKDYTTYLDKNGIKGTGDLKSLIDQVNKSNAELKRTLSGDTTGTYGNDVTKGTQDLKKWYDQLLSAMQQTVDLEDEIKQGYLDTHEAAMDMLDEAIEKREYINELLEHEIDLYQLTYGINPDKDYYNTMNGYYQALYTYQLQQIQRLRANVKLLEEQWKRQLEAGNTELAKQYEERYKENLSSLNSLLIKSIETLKEKYSNAIDGIFNELDRRLSSNASGLGGSSLGYMNMEWQLMNQNAELYLDNVEAMYSMQSLQNKFQKAIDDDKNVKNQQALKKVMDEQLDILKQKGKITKYDVERAEKLLQIEKARIALEQAQSNKTSMRLKRDAQGNYSYQFVADTSQVEDAQQALLDLQSQLYTFDKQAYQDNLNNALNAYKDYQSRVKDILLDTALTQEEKDQQIALVKEQLETYITDLAKENKAIRINLAQDTVTALTSTYTDNVDAFSDMTTKQKDLVDQLRTGGREAIQGLSDDQYEILFSATGMVENWNTGIQRMINKINSTDGGFEQVCLDAWGKISTATTDYKDQVAEVAREAGQDLDSITSSTWALNDAVLDTLDSQKDLTEAFGKQLTAAGKLITQLQKLRKKYEEVAAAAKKAMNDANVTITNASNNIKNNNTTGGSTSGGNKTKTSKTLPNFEALVATNVTSKFISGRDPSVLRMLYAQATDYINKNKHKAKEKRSNYKAPNQLIYDRTGGNVLGKEQLKKLATMLHVEYSDKNLYDALKAIGYAKGSKNIPKDMIAWTQEQGQEAIYDKSRQAILTPLGKGDKVFTAEMTDALWNVAEAIVNSKQTTQPNNPSWDMLKDQSKRRSINQAQVDTAKGMAAAVELLRDISQELPTSLFDKAFNLNNGYLKDLIANISKDVFNNINDTQQTQQTVTITASFPAVNSKKEIEEAFENLINMAAQRTMRNNNDNRRRRGL